MNASEMTATRTATISMSVRKNVHFSILCFLILAILCQETYSQQKQEQKLQQNQLQQQKPKQQQQLLQQSQNPLQKSPTKLSGDASDSSTYPLKVDNQMRYDAPDDCHYRPIDTDEVSLTCVLRTVNSEFDMTNFSVIPSEHTASLTIICDNDVQVKSSLEPRSFVHLSRLKELTFEYCKLGSFSADILFGLNNLRNLTIRTENIIWPVINLEIEPNSFSFVKNLDWLDLSQNNIWSLPDNLFCSLGRLTFLNISDNRLQDINELGFSDKPKLQENITSSGSSSNASSSSSSSSNSSNSSNSSTSSSKSSDVPQKLASCTLDLEILDLSYNNYIVLPPYGFSLLRRLKHLKISNNEISMVGDKALNGLKNLQVLNLSSNKIVALPSELLSDAAATIQEVYLQNNSIGVLAPKLFANLEQLQALDLSSNQITSAWIDKHTFVGLIRLVLLNLSHNRITKLEPEIFSDLYTLQILNLRYNQLENIAADTFSPMNNLHTLLLSHNRLKYLDAYALNGLYVLSLLSLDNNALIGVHPEAFRNCSSLQDLNLNFNQLKSVPMALRNMRHLRTVDLGENGISLLEESGFRGLTNLYGLRLISNQLENITVNAFKDLPSLQILNLARNRIQIIEPGAFEMTDNIQAIRLDGNQITDITGLFANMPSLVWLNLSDNQLEFFDFAQIPQKLQWLDLHKNELTELSNQYLLDNQLQLQTLDASFNRLHKVTPHTIPNSIQLLLLNNNLIRVIEPHTFMYKSNLTRVDLYANQITTLDIKALRILPVGEHSSLAEFYIGGNPFVCDCNIDWLQKINHLTSHQYPRIMDLETIYCKLLNHRERVYIPLIDAEPRHFLCTYNTHCFALCHCCEFDACDCEMTCPNNCTCLHDQSWSTNVVECSGFGHSEVPPNIPMDTTEVYIDGNNLIELSGHSFIGRKRLVVLFANNSNIQIIYNTTFSGLQRLRVLHIEDNKITRLVGNEFEVLESLKELYLHNNRISYIANNTFLNLRKLEVLRLDGNRLVQFEVWQLTLNPYLVEIALAENMWSCECSYLTRFRNYLQTSSEKIIDANRIACIYNNLTSILREKNGTKCTLRDSLSTYVRTSEIEDLLPLLLAATCAFIGFFCLILGIFCYRHELNMWAHSNCFLSFCYKSTNFDDNFDKDRLYDSYIAYSLQDEHFVNQILSNTLENDVGYRMCLHYRDLNVNSYVADAIIEAVESSKQAVLVLSKNFLYNEWTRFEYKSAIHEIIKRRRRLVFVLYGDLPQRDIDTDMRHYLRTNTCIEWDDKKFWQKLRIALPHVRKNHCLAKRSGLNIYATAHGYGPPRPDCPKRFDCNNYATINDCTRNYNGGFDAVSCKYNNSTGNESSHAGKNELAVKSLERKHEYAVPSSCLIGSTSNYSLGFDRHSPAADKNCECCPTTMGRFGSSMTTSTAGGGGGVGSGGGSTGAGECNRSLSNSTSGCIIQGGGSAGSGSISANFSTIPACPPPATTTPVSNGIFNYTKNCNCNSPKFAGDKCRCNRYDSNGSLSDINSIDKRLPQALWA